MTKYAGKFRKNDDYNDDYEYTKSSRTNKRKKNEHGEIKKKLKQWEYENRHDDEEYSNYGY